MVILGGLLSSTLLDIIVTPVVFRLLGRKALEQYRQNHAAPALTVSLDAPPFTPPTDQNPAPAVGQAALPLSADVTLAPVRKKTVNIIAKFRTTRSLLLTAWLFARFKDNFIFP